MTGQIDEITLNIWLIDALEQKRRDPELLEILHRRLDVAVGQSLHTRPPLRQRVMGKIEPCGSENQTRIASQELAS